MKQRSILIVLTLFIFVLPEAANATAGDCIRIENDLDRLACYDKAVGRTPKQQAVAAPAGEWSVHKETSKMTDQTNIYMSVKSKEVVDCGWNRGGRVRLSVRCRENTTALIFNTGCHMTSSRYNSYGDITYRIDDAKAKTVSGNESNNHKALGLWSGGQSIPLIKEMFGARQMIVRMTPYGQNAFTATFNIAGLESSIKPLRAACNW